MRRERWMCVLFAIGSTCFLVGPFPGYVDLVGPEADARHVLRRVDLLHRPPGRCRVWLALPGRGADWWAAIIQSAGTLFFNVTTFRALDTALGNPDYDALVWRPDAFGSICFLVSGVIAYVASHAARLVAGARRPGVVVPGGQPARLHLLRHLGRRGLRRAGERVHDRPGRGELEHVARRRLLPRLRARSAVG